ncbi:MAG: hypothetical protein HZB65_04150 [Candidatus Aenigmarchaeota archaeon]|nr:hypothetical protein [Candidatus Aenigmarchaeota archaeon]
MDAYNTIKTMKIQGASETAILALEHLKKYSKLHGFGSGFEKECHRFIRVRPTAVVMHNILSMVLRNRNEKEIDRLIKELTNARKRIAMNGKSLFKGRKKTIMTHCHSHEVIEFLKANKSRIKYVYVTETRPRMQGVLTAKDLANARIVVRFITDSAAGSYIEDIDMIVVGADALRTDGVVNKTGTFELCILAKEFHKPVYVIADTFKLDRRKRFIIEQRPAGELGQIAESSQDSVKIASLHSLRQIASLRSVNIMNPAFDITPWKYIHEIVTEKGIFKPDKIKR